MKQKDLALIILVVVISADRPTASTPCSTAAPTMISFFISGRLFPSPKNRQQQVDVVQPITSDFPSPNPRYFNKQAFDPTQPITIGQNANPNPFNSPTR